MHGIFLRFFLPVLLLGLMAPIVAMLFVEPSHGDLTRTGFLPERQFGRTEPQPPLLRRTRNAADSEASTLVVGDSFSGIGFWQEIALGRNERYVTYSFGRLCSDIADTLRKKRLAPRVVIIQVVERYFDERFFSSCDHSRLEDAAPNALLADPEMPSRSIFSGSYGAKYVAGSLLYFLRRGEQHRPGHSGGVYVNPIADGCLLFSNRDCEFGLFLGDDRTMAGLPLDKFKSPVVSYLKDAGVQRILILPIPNKTSVYLEPVSKATLKDAYLAEFARQNGVELVPLFERFDADRRRTRDFYLPNDTHLSARGMKVLGEYVGEHFRK
jgi:hypothetical protein